jgi:hypothetical protein
MLDLMDIRLSVSGMPRLFGIADLEDQIERNFKKLVLKKAAIECVYYVAVGKHIKIGYTTDLRQRMLSYPSGDLLATEKGHDDLEHRRHQQFREYLDRGNEWFLRGPRLMAHIDSLKS